MKDLGDSHVKQEVKKSRCTPVALKGKSIDHASGASESYNEFPLLPLPEHLSSSTDFLWGLNAVFAGGD